MTWDAAPAAAAYDVEWSRKPNRWHAAGHIRTPATSALLPVTGGTWWYRVRGINPSLPGSPKMTWSARCGSRSRSRPTASSGARDALRRLAKTEAGFGLIELLIAMTVMVIAIMAIVAAFSSGMVALNRASQRIDRGHARRQPDGGATGEVPYALDHADLCLGVSTAHDRIAA